MTAKPRWHLDYLDSLTGIAVLGVVMVHSALWGDSFLRMRTWVVDIAATGQRGVSLFFVVSAFTLFLSHDNRRERSPTLDFFLRRFFRLAPMFYIATILTIVFLPQFAGPWRDILLSIFFLHGFAASAIAHGAAGGWSVADEAIFYMLLPFLFSRIRNLTTALVWMCVGTTACYLLRPVLAGRFPQYSGFFMINSFIAQFPVFLFGITGYFFWKEYIAPGTISIATSKQFSLMLLMLTAFIYWSFVAVTDENLYQSTLPSAMLLLALSLYPWPLIVNSFSRFLGKISFSLYLLHFVVFLSIKKWVISATSSPPFLALHSVRFLGCFFGTLLITMPIATVTWRWIEEPGIALGRRIIGRIESKKSPERVPASTL